MKARPAATGKIKYYAIASLDDTGEFQGFVALWNLQFDSVKDAETVAARYRRAYPEQNFEVCGVGDDGNRLDRFGNAI